MIVIDDKIISDDVLDKKFLCDLARCKGACCVEGESGAPLEIDELDQLEDCYEEVKDYMTREGRELVEKEGHFVLDKSDGSFKTPLLNGAACAYVNFENGISYCSIEKAWLEKKSEFRKPVSCHLYPVRISKHEKYDAVNYEDWDICSPACEKGNAAQLPVYKFLKQALIRKYGEEFFKQLDGAAQYRESQNP